MLSREPPFGFQKNAERCRQESLILLASLWIAEAYMDRGTGGLPVGPAVLHDVDARLRSRATSQ